MKDELNFSYIGGGVVYLLQIELSTSTLQYMLIFKKKIYIYMVVLSCLLSVSADTACQLHNRTCINDH